MTIGLLIAGIILAALSGVPGLFYSRKSSTGEQIATGLMILAAVCGMGSSALVLSGISSVSSINCRWSVPGGAFALRVDAISAMFVGQILLISAVGSIYGLGYWRQVEHGRDGRKLRLFYGLMAAGMLLLVSARNTMLFMAGWEIMALAAFMTVTAQDNKKPVRQVGYLYLVATRLGTLCLFAMFALLYTATGTFDFAAQLHSSPVATAIFVLAVVGFGLKAGIMPMHVWLPGAHGSAPSHVSAVMSGVLIKTGIYGLVRVCSLFPHPPIAWGATILILGGISGVLGVAFAIGQHDLKRLLAYHSVENIGIICMGLGVALLGRSLGRGELVVLGLAGSLLHIWNHGLFKALLFLCAGTVLHATHTGEIDRLGGLVKRMPWTTLGFLTGAVAICGLPPLNGFVSELLIYLGLFKSAALPSDRLWLAGALGAPVLALIGALATACFVKAFGAAFLGESRSTHVDAAHDPASTMLGPMALLMALCVLIGLMPLLVAPILDRAIIAWAPEWQGAVRPLATLAPLHWVSISGLVLVGLMALGTLLLYRLIGKKLFLAAAGGEKRAQTGTWDCGYAAPSPTMQYSSSSFARTLVGLFSWALRPQNRVPRIRAIFPRPETFHSHVPDAVLDGMLIPATQFGGRAARWFKLLQSGNEQAYLLYILVTLLVLLLWR